MQIVLHIFTKIIKITVIKKCVTQYIGLLKVIAPNLWFIFSAHEPGREWDIIHCELYQL